MFIAFDSKHYYTEFTLRKYFFKQVHACSVSNFIYNTNRLKTPKGS